MPFQLSHQMTCRGLSNEGCFTYRRLKKKICHTVNHKFKCVLWALYHIKWKSKLSKVIFFDEKNFNLDEPDGVTHYWYDLRQSQKNFLSRHSGGRSDIIWTAMWANGNTDSSIIENTMDSKLYITFLEQCLLPFSYITYASGRKDFVFCKIMRLCTARSIQKIGLWRFIWTF